MTASASSPAALAGLDTGEIGRLLAGDHDDPHRILGAHRSTSTGAAGVILRAMHPDAVRAEALLADGKRVELERLAGGLFGAFIAGASLPLRYRLRFHFGGGATWERGDPYRFLPTVGEIDLHLFNEGTHRELWNVLGAHPREIDGERGVSFAVWAPNARSAAVVGQHEQWDGRLLPMRRLGSSGVFELFVPDVAPGTMYKYQLRTREGIARIKTDPFAFGMEAPPETASCVVDLTRYAWKDGEWMTERPTRDSTKLPMLIYELHLGSWARIPENDNRPLTYRELAPRVVEHCQRLGFSHVELMPVMEHPFTGSWGYQVSGYFAPTRRYGSPDDFKYFVDVLHRAGIGVILDWVPAHFPKDDFALRRFDGTALYEHDDPRLGEHPDWGTLIFNYSRTEVRNFLIANALFWLREYHCDGLRVDAVASMLYLDYSRKPGEWLRNRQGGRENLDAIDFLRAMNEAVRIDAPGCYTIAEESTSWPGVTKSPREGGLGFTYKWNMGWMHDTLAYFAQDPLYRSYHQDQLTFAMVYEYSERFIMPLSHDEVVHLKKSLLEKMPGDSWRKLANLRLMLAYMYTRPGKKLLFMGTEIAPYAEWDHDVSLDWHLADEPSHGAFLRFVQELGALYESHAAFWRDDFEPQGFSWIDIADKMNSVLSYVRRAGESHAIVVLNMTPEPRANYRLGVPSEGEYDVLISSDSVRFGGSGYGQEGVLHTDPSSFHGYPQSLSLNLPPLGALVLAPR